MADIYNDGSYITNSPELHLEDSDFKFEEIRKLLDNTGFKPGKVKILDVGGGAGKIGRLVCDYFVGKGHMVEFVALDMSEQMLEIQKKNNPHLGRMVNSSLEELDQAGFDLILMIDVIEHIPDTDEAARRLNALGDNCIYNIPIQINAFDLLRHLLHRGAYYPDQTRLIGHLHFFSISGAMKFIRKNHKVQTAHFKPYCSLMLASSAPAYVELRKSRLRLAEVKLSCWVEKYAPLLAPFIVQGSLFAHVRAPKDEKRLASSDAGLGR